jgi:hypothetical protein
LYYDVKALRSRWSGFKSKEWSINVVEEGSFVNKLAMCSVALVLLLVLGCAVDVKYGAGAQAGEKASVPSGSAPAGGNSQPARQPDPAANGGSTLTASAPYSHGNGASAPQNVNPAPFMTASQASASASSVPANALTSRADGTMMGPNDQPAAGTGPETPGQPATSNTATSPVTGRKPAAPRPRTPAANRVIPR